MAFDFIAGYVLGSRQAGKASAMASTASSFAGSSTSGRIHELADRFDRLVLVVEAMWSMLEAEGYSQEDLAAMMEELDRADGATDGRHLHEARRCPACDAVLGKGVTVCQFCGKEVGRAENPFSAV